MVSSKFNVLSSSMLNLVTITGDECHKKGLLALKNGNDKKAFDLFSQGYGKFHGPCVRELGKMHLNGHYVDIDLDKAMYFFKRGAYNYKDQSCNFLVGDIYCHELEDELSPEGTKVLHCLDSMDISVEPIQQWLIGEMYRLGLGHEKSFDRAMFWYNRALERLESTEIKMNESFCKNVYLSMGKIYEEGGYGEEQNYPSAFNCYEKAADQKCTEAYDKIGNLYKLGLGVPVNHKRAFNWYFKAATGGQNSEPCTSGQFNLGMMYKDGLGTEIDNDSAMFWLKKAAYAGNSEAGDYVEQMHQTSIMEIRKKHFIERENQLQSYKIKEIQLNNVEKNVILTEEKIDSLMTQYFERWESIGAEHKNQIECNK
ncbi:unnamed protein product [Mucor hiemalis]